MNQQDREHIHAIVDAVIDGKVVEYRGPFAWDTDERIGLNDLLDRPLRYRIKPETITIHVHRSPETGAVWADSRSGFIYPDAEHLYSFEHTVQETDR